MCRWGRRSDDPSFLHGRRIAPRSQHAWAGSESTRSRLQRYHKARLPLYSARYSDRFPCRLEGDSRENFPPWLQTHIGLESSRAANEYETTTRTMQRTQQEPVIQKWTPAAEQRKTGREAIFLQIWAQWLPRPNRREYSRQEAKREPPKSTLFHIPVQQGSDLNALSSDDARENALVGSMHWSHQQRPRRTQAVQSSSQVQLHGSSGCTAESPANRAYCGEECGGCRTLKTGGWTDCAAVVAEGSSKDSFLHFSSSLSLRPFEHAGPGSRIGAVLVTSVPKL